LALGDSCTHSSAQGSSAHGRSGQLSQSEVLVELGHRPMEDLSHRELAQPVRHEALLGLHAVALAPHAAATARIKHATASERAHAQRSRARVGWRACLLAADSALARSARVRLLRGGVKAERGGELGPGSSPAATRVRAVLVGGASPKGGGMPTRTGERAIGEHGHGMPAEQSASSTATSAVALIDSMAWRSGRTRAAGGVETPPPSADDDAAAAPPAPRSRRSATRPERPDELEPKRLLRELPLVGVSRGVSRERSEELPSCGHARVRARGAAQQCARVRARGWHQQRDRHGTRISSATTRRWFDRCRGYVGRGGSTVDHHREARRERRSGERAAVGTRHRAAAR
jgi:hypothetical protein